ncbi:DNA alkylation repair protein [Aliikangiella marina]|uniref:DNA alkylation repair protein n=1 Tax=Aliikangiella marina TaxID=1712262 RepID=A0A545T1J3_9GAMM|nr:DNA alkylation repair protein [Aliikangiella marina]TQV71055.1 DNA alkylation repair protein [Aliikangiella marina]
MTEPLNSMESEILKSLHNLANHALAQSASGFFKTEPGGYGEGDQFIGIRVPVIRQQVKQFKPVPLSVCEKLLSSPFHEVRMFALLAMVEIFNCKKNDRRTAVYQSYMANLRYINNWDLVDCACYKIVGPFLEDKPRDVLYQLAQSNNLWERRIAIVATYHFIKAGDFKDTLAIANLLQNDHHDLIHKAVGWMLKLVGQQNESCLLDYLKPRYGDMPRTLLRTAIEKLPGQLRQDLLNNKF